MTATFDIRVRRYGTLPAGAPAVIPCDTIDFTAPLDGIPVVSFKASALTAGPIKPGDEIAVEVWDGSVWREVEHGRHLIVSTSWDETDPLSVVSATCVSYATFLLARAALRSFDGAARAFNDTVGVIIAFPLDEAVSRGWGAELGYAFNGAIDSNGQPWANDCEISFPPGVSALSMLGKLADQNLLQWTTRARELIVVNPGTGVDRAAGAAPVRVGRLATKRPAKDSISDLFNRVILRPDDAAGKTYESTEGLALGLGRLEREVTANGIATDSATLSLLGQLELARSRQKRSTTITESSAALDGRPLVDYALGDTVSARIGDTWEPARVIEVQIRRGTDGLSAVDVLVQDRISTYADALEARAASLGVPTAGNGVVRLGGGGSSGQSELKLATVDSAYSGGGAPARVAFDGTTSLSEPLPYLASYLPFAGDSVAVAKVAGVGDTIVGRIAANTPGTSAGSVEYLAPGPGWQSFDPGRFGEFSIRRLASDWVLLGGVLKGPSEVVPAGTVVATIPGSYRPQRASVWFHALLGEPSTLAISRNNTTQLRLDCATGELLTTAQLPADSTLSLADARWNISTDVSTLYSSGAEATGWGLDSDGLGFLFGNPQTGLPGSGLPSPRKETRHRRTSEYSGSSTWGGDRTDSVRVGLDGSWFIGSDIYAEGCFWNPVGSPSGETTLPLINGFTAIAGREPRYGKTASGLVFFTGQVTTAGVRGQSIGQLPAGFRPSHELLGMDCRITPGGAIISGTSTAVVMFSMTFVAGR